MKKNNRCAIAHLFIFLFFLTSEKVLNLVFDAGATGMLEFLVSLVLLLGSIKVFSLHPGTKVFSLKLYFIGVTVFLFLHSLLFLHHWIAPLFDLPVSFVFARTAFFIGVSIVFMGFNTALFSFEIGGMELELESFLRDGPVTIIEKIFLFAFGVIEFCYGIHVIHKANNYL